MRKRCGIYSPILTLVIAVALQTACNSPPKSSHAESMDKQPPSQTVAQSSNLLEYITVYTQGATSKSSCPTIFAVHGLGDSPEGISSLYNHLPFPARIILPRAPTSYSTGYAWFPYRFEGQDPIQLKNGIQEAANRVAELITSIPSLDERKPIITGFSQGGMISFAVALLHPDKVRAAVPLAGFAPDAFYPKDNKAASKIPRIVAYHGMDDTVVSYTAAVQSVQSLKAKGVNVDLFSYENVGHRVSPTMQKDYFQLLTSL